VRDLRFTIGDLRLAAAGRASFAEAAAAWLLNLTLNHNLNPLIAVGFASTNKAEIKQKITIKIKIKRGDGA
jgi:hypothetical protein